MDNQPQMKRGEKEGRGDIQEKTRREKGKWRIHNEIHEDWVWGNRNTTAFS